MRRGLLLPLLLCLACGPHTSKLRGRSPGADTCAMMYLRGTDLAQAQQCFARRHAANALSVEERFLWGDLLDVTGKPAAAMEQYFQTVQHAAQLGDRSPVVTAAAMGIVAIRDRVEGFTTRFDGFHAALTDKADALPAEARFQLQNLAHASARRRGDYSSAETLLRLTGCLTHWHTIGPFGPNVWSLFDDRAILRRDSPFPHSAHLGPGRKLAAARTVRSRTCTVYPADPAWPLPGRVWAQTGITLDRPRAIALRLETSNAAVVYAGGIELVRRDPRQTWPGRVSWFKTTLPAGTTEIRVGLATDQSSYGFSLVALDEDGGRALFSHGPSPGVGRPVRRPDGSIGRETPASRYAELKIALWWDDIELAMGLIDHLAADHPSPILLLAEAEALSVDPSMPGDIAYERAQGLLARALELAPSLWHAQISLADEELVEERLDRAIAMLQRGIASCPDEPQLRRRLISLYMTEGWLNEADSALAALQELIPGSCDTLAWTLARARQTEQLTKARELARRLADCDRASSSFAEELTRAQRYDEALAERRRLARRDPTAAAPLIDLAQAALAVGDLELAARVARQALDRVPAETRTRLLLADLLLARGDQAAAMNVLEQGQATLPSPQAQLLIGESIIAERRLLSEMRIDGRPLIDAYIAASPIYDTPAVFVLDRMVHLINEDGASTALVHVITHLTSDEAIEANGEFELPPNALLLTARTIKSSGQVLVTQPLAGKSSLSLPNLEPGDFIETEYLQFFEPNALFPGGFDTARFYFRNYDTAFHRSEFITVLPHGLDYVLDPRGDCPKHHVEDGPQHRVLTWRVAGTLPMIQEPRSPAVNELLPSIRVVSNAGGDIAFARLRDLLADKNRPSRAIRQVVTAVVSGLEHRTPSAIRKALYRWVMDRVEEDGGLFDQASQMIVSRTGNRTRVFAALLEAIGDSPRLAAVTPTGADDTETEVISFNAFDRIALYIPQEGWINFDQESARYGYLPPELRFRPVRFFDNGEAGRTDAGAIPRDRQAITLSLEVMTDGTARGSITEELEGGLAAQWRTRLEEMSPGSLNRYFQEEYLAGQLPGATLVSLRAAHQSNFDRPLVLHYQVEIPLFAQLEGRNLHIDLPFPITLVKQIGGLPVRTTPLVLSSFIDKSVRATITWPKGYRVDLPSPVPPVRTKWGQAERSVEAIESGIRLGYRARMEATRLAAAKYREFLDFAGKLDQVCQLELTLLAD